MGSILLFVHVYFSYICFWYSRFCLRTISFCDVRYSIASFRTSSKSFFSFSTAFTRFNWTKQKMKHLSQAQYFPMLQMWWVKCCGNPHLFSSHLVEGVDALRKLGDWRDETRTSDDVFEKLEHSVFVLSLRSRFHHRNLLHFALRMRDNVTSGVHAKKVRINL